MTIDVLLFGPQAQLVGDRAVTVRLPGDSATCAELRAALARAAPSLATSLPHSGLAVNHAFASEDQRIGSNDEVALIGMISGG